jgi:RHS repeat-associated protein
LLGEYDNKQIPIYETVYLNDTPVAVIKQTRTPNPNTQPQTYTVSTEIFNVYADHIDTPRVITKATDQSIVWSWITAEPFGATPPNSNPNNLGVFTFNQRFPGQVYDAETNLHQNWNREYQSLTGKYLTSDPIGLAGGSMSLYTYVSSNPLSRTDSKGLKDVPGAGGGGGDSFFMCPLIAQSPIGIVPAGPIVLSIWYCVYDCNRSCPGKESNLVTEIQWDIPPHRGCYKAILPPVGK